MTSSEMTVELAATCNSLGYFDAATNKYYADDNTLETVKDLIRYLRRDDVNHEIRRYLGHTKVVQTDLLPLLKNYWKQDDLFDILLRLLANLTTPALLLWNEEPPTDRSSRNYYLQIEDHLHSYKEAFADDQIWACLSMRLSKILEIDYAERGDANGLIIERILVLIRNVLYVPTNPDLENRPDNDANVHDQVLWALHQSGLLDIVLYIASTDNEHAYYMYTLEILSYMFREQSASDLAQAALQRSQTEKIRDEAELLAIRHREMNHRQDKVKMFTGARHSRFGGTFVVKSMKSISDNELIYHKPLNKLDELNFDMDKKKPKTPKNRLPVQKTCAERRSTFAVRLFLKEFCIEFLQGAYNTVMHYVKDRLARAKGQNNDESYYLWAMRFFMEFNRRYRFEMGLVSETMSIQTFHFVQQQMEHSFDMLNTDKKKIALWSRRLHLALLAYRELLLSICTMDKSPDGSVRDSARVIKSNVFYVLEYREFILSLLVTFDELKMSNLYLNDLLETQHIFLKMFETYCGKDNSIMFQAVKRIKKKRSKASKSVPVAAEAPEIDIESQWDEIAPQLSAVLEGTSEIPSDVVPFDATLPIPIDDQKSMAMLNIQKLFRKHEFERGVAFLRAAREVWSESDAFGTNSMAPEEEFLAIREIFFAELQDDSQPKPKAPVQPVAEEKDEGNEETDEEEEEDETGHGMDLTETNFKFEDFLKRFCHPKIVRACSLSLNNFDRNTVHTNHCTVKLLHRIAFDCKMSTMLFQVSVFRIFQRIFTMRPLPQYKELCKFATYIMQQFVKATEENDKVYLEALFWKSSREACDIDDCYQGNTQKSSAAARAWTELEEDELRRLFMEHQETQIEEDVVDWLVKNLIDHTRTRRGVLKKLKDMYLLTNYKPKKSGPNTSGRNQKHWTEEEEHQLAELFEEFRDAMDPLTCIMERLDVARPKNRIIEKLLIMGLIQDRKEVRKKRASKRSHGRNEDHDNNSEIDSSSSDDDDNSRSPARNRPSKKTFTKAKQSSITLQTKSEIGKHLRQLLENGMSEALEWLRDSIQEVAEDIETEEDAHGVPLVPIMESALAAMDSPIFQALLKAIGINEPADEQETYWRISGQLSLPQLRSICQNLTDALEGRLPPISEEPSEELPQQKDSSSDDEDIFERLRKNMKPRSPEKINSSSGSSISKELSQKSSQSTVRSRRTSNSSNRSRSISSDNESTSVTSQSQKSSQNSSRKRRTSNSSNRSRSISSDNGSTSVTSQSQKSSQNSSRKRRTSNSSNRSRSISSDNGSTSVTSQSQKSSQNSSRKRRTSMSSSKSKTDDNLDESANITLTPNEDSSQSSSRKRKRRTSKSFSRSRSRSSSSNSDESTRTVTHSQNTSRNSIEQRRTSRATSQSSSSDDEHSSNRNRKQISTQNSVIKKRSQSGSLKNRKKKLVAFQSDSSDDSEKENVTNNDSNNIQVEDALEINSKSTRFIESDSESVTNDNAPKIKRARILQIDEDSD